MRIGSLFSGAGGLDIAVEQVFDAETVWHVENNPAASKVLKYRWPGVPNHHDITTTDWTAVEPVDILCGGWPCQPFSQAGKRLGADDERALWPHVAGAVRLLRPRIVVLENVSAVLGPEFSRVADDLAEAGYEFAWVCVRASDVGAPHRRERVFIFAIDTAVAERGGTQPADRVTRLGGAEPVNLLPTPRSQDGNGYQQDPEADIGNNGRTVSLADRVTRLLPTPRSHRRGDCESERNRHDPDLEAVTHHFPLLATPRTSDRFGAGLHGDGGLDLRTTVSLLPTPTVSDGDGGGMNAESDLSLQIGDAARRGDQKLRDVTKQLTRWGKYAPAVQRWEQATRPAPAPTEPNRNGNPRLNPQFSEWMMGWPNGWVTAVPGISRNDTLRIIGNGVVPQQAAAALRHLFTLIPATVGA